MLGLILKGFLIGILISAPMGPVGILCIQRTLQKGRWHGFFTGLGATLSDIIYALITCLGMGVVINFVQTNEAPLQVIGSILLGLFGFYLFTSNPVKNLRKQNENRSSYAQDFITGFLLTFSNILIVILFIGLFARFGFVSPEHTSATWFVGILGIALGAIIWWFCITFVVSLLSKWFNVRGIWVLNKVVGTVILTLSLAGLCSALLTTYLHIPLL